MFQLPGKVQMCGIGRRYIRATSVKTAYALPEKTSCASLCPSISASQAVCAWTLNREVMSPALAVSCDERIAPKRMMLTTIFLGSETTDAGLLRQAKLSRPTLVCRRVDR